METSQSWISWTFRLSRGGGLKTATDDDVLTGKLDQGHDKVREGLSRVAELRGERCRGREPAWREGLQGQASAEQRPHRVASEKTGPFGLGRECVSLSSFQLPNPGEDSRWVV